MSSTPTPPRPAGVPEDAKYLAKNNLWWVGETIDGKSRGEWTAWHATLGYRFCVSRFDDEGELVHVTRYHPDGDVAHENPHRKNALHGTVLGFRAKPPAYDPYFDHLPAAIARYEMPMVDGMIAGPNHFFDAEGNELSVTGLRKPEHIPAAATAGDSDGDWTLGEGQLGAAYQGVRTIWRGDGTLRYVDSFDRGRTWLRRVSYDEQGAQARVSVYAEGLPEAPPPYVIQKPDPAARPVAWHFDRKWLLPATGDATSVATYFHADGTRWLEVPHEKGQPVGLLLFDAEGALALEERWHPAKKVSGKRKLAAITCHTMPVPRTITFETSGKVIAFTEGEVWIDLMAATKKTKPDAAFFAACFTRYFAPWLNVPDVHLTFKTLHIASLAVTDASMKEPFAATELLGDGSGNTYVLIEEGALAGKVVFFDHEEGAGGLDDINDFIADEEDLEGLRGDALIKAMSLSESVLAPSVVHLLRGIRFHTTSQHFDRYV